MNDSIIWGIIGVVLLTMFWFFAVSAKTGFAGDFIGFDFSWFNVEELTEDQAKRLNRLDFLLGILQATLTVIFYRRSIWFGFWLCCALVLANTFLIYICEEISERRSESLKVNNRSNNSPDVA